MGLRQWFDRIADKCAPGQPYENYYALFDTVRGVFYHPVRQTQTTAHVRDGIDLQRIMIMVWLCVLPALFFGMWNIGYQANLVFDQQPYLLTQQSGWRFEFLQHYAGFDPHNIWHNFLQGALWFLPIYLVTFVVGGFWEVLFASVRKKVVNEGFWVTSCLFALTLPASVPLWQVALGISFGVVIGKEIFGGTGMNFLNPALVGRAFLFFAYPADMSGESVWVMVDGYAGATALSLAAAGGVHDVTTNNIAWLNAFLGSIQGSVGETSKVAILLGGIVLMLMRIASWRIVFGVVLGVLVMSGLFNIIGSETNPMFSMPWYWHFVVGGLMFGMMFMATDPVSAAMTNTGKWVYGVFIGVFIILLRVLNPAFPESTMLAILLANICAPLMDYFVVRANIKRRQARHD